MSQEFEIKRLSLEEQRDRLQQQLDNLKEELSAKLNMANQEARKHLADLACFPFFCSFNWLNLLLFSSGVAPPGAGEGGAAEPGLSSDTDHLSEGDSGEAQDRAGRNQSPSPRDQQPGDRPAGERENRSANNLPVMQCNFPANKWCNNFLPI